jgi:PAS domain S-box-containing protein
MRNTKFYAALRSFLPAFFGAPPASPPVSSGYDAPPEKNLPATLDGHSLQQLLFDVPDMVFSLDRKGEVVQVNPSVTRVLGYEKNDLHTTAIDSLFEEGGRSGPVLTAALFSGEPARREALMIKPLNGEPVPVEVKAMPLLQPDGKMEGYLLIVKDGRLAESGNQAILRARIEAQEDERRRLAKDMHDSLCQQLSAIRLYICSTKCFDMNEEQKIMVQKSSEALGTALSEVRSLCFNLMPVTLEQHGLHTAVREFCGQLQRTHNIAFIIEIGENVRLAKELELDIYRIIQEFVQNALKHGRASRVRLHFDFSGPALRVSLSENGKGFKLHRLGRGGMGFENMKSRMKSHNGKINISSKIGKGTRCVLIIPNINPYEARKRSCSRVERADS